MTAEADVACATRSTVGAISASAAAGSVWAAAGKKHSHCPDEKELSLRIRSDGSKDSAGQSKTERSI